MTSCGRCSRPAPIDVSELTGDGGGDPALLPVIVPPVGWLADPDLDNPEDGLICGKCASNEEIIHWLAGLALVESVMEGDGLE